MKFLTSLAALLFLAGAAHAQTTVRQSGQVTPGHLGSWTTNGVIQDAGTPANPKVTGGLGVVSDNQETICTQNALTNYSRLCLGVTDTAAYLSLGNFGGATLPLNIVVNGTAYPFPQGAAAFLPLAGGTLTGLLTINTGVAAPSILTAGTGHFGWITADANAGGTVVWNSSTRNGNGTNVLYATGNVSGTAAVASGVPTQFLFTVASDRLDSSSTGGFYASSFYHNFGGVGFAGSHTAMFVNMTQNAAITAAGGFYGVLNLHFASNSAVSSGGNAIVLNPQLILGSGSTGYGLAELIEGGLISDTPLISRGGVVMFTGGTQGGSRDDYAFGMARNPSSIAWETGFLVSRSDSAFPVSGTGSIVKANEQITNNASGTGTQQVTFGWNLPNIYHSNAAWWTPGIKVTGGGKVFAGNAQFGQIPTGQVLDVSGYIASSPTISVAGTGYQVGDQLHDGLGGIISVTSVGASGVLTGIVYLVGSDGFAIAAHSFGGAGPATLAAAGGHGSGGVIGVTWTQKLELALQTSGGTLSINGLAAVNCAAGIAPTGAFTVRQGIVTAC